MAFTYSPKTWTGPHFQEIFSEAVYSNKTLDKNLVRVIEGIKSEQYVTSLTGAPVVQDYTVTPSTPLGGLTFSDTLIKPVKKMVHDRFDMNDFLATRFNSDMASGAARMESNEFLSAVITYIVPRISKAIEADFWSKVITKLNAASNEIAVAGAILTAGNIVTEIGKVYAALPGEALEEGKGVTIYAPHAVRSMILQANLDQVYRDKFTVSGDAIAYLGVPVEFVPLPANVMTAGVKTDYVLGTDLLSDQGSIEVNKVSNESDLLFYKAVFTMDAAVCIPEQKVLYKV